MIDTHRCGYCRGQRCPCTCSEDCGARAGEFTGAHCPRAEGYVDWLRSTGLYSEQELSRLADRGAQ
jgi:hypothetical protein